MALLYLLRELLNFHFTKNLFPSSFNLTASVWLFPDSNAAMKFINHERTAAWVTPTKIFFNKLLHVLPLVEHPQRDADVWALVELLDEGVDDPRHPDGGHKDPIRL